MGALGAASFRRTPSVERGGDERPLPWQAGSRRGAGTFPPRYLPVLKLLPFSFPSHTNKGEEGGRILFASAPEKYNLCNNAAKMPQTNA